MTRVSGVIYDCDGVLFESQKANLAYYNQVLTVFGVLPVTEDQTERAHLCHTAASPQVFAELLGDEHVVAALSIARDIDFRQFFCHMLPEPGMARWLQDLSTRIPLAVATNRGTSMPEILDHFNLATYFSAVVTSRDVERPKPSPDMLLLAAARLAIEPEELLFVGDSILDRQAAQAAGIRFVAYRTSIGAEWRIDRHAQLGAVIEGFSSGI